MRGVDFNEKRKSRRLDLSIPMSIRHKSDNGKEKTQEGLTINVSYNGAYLVDISLKDISPKDKINISLSVPRDDARDFPFSRVIGKAKVVRVDKEGVALEFGDEVSRLFVAN